MKKSLLFSLFCITVASAQIQSENFEGNTMPTGWTEEISGPGHWTFGSNIPPFSSNPHFASNAAVFNDDALGDSSGASVASLLSPPIDVTQHNNVTLSFSYYFNEFSGAGIFRVSVFNGTSWVQLQENTTDVINMESVSYDVTQYKNAQFQVKFTFDDEGGWSWGAAVDNFLLQDNLAIVDRDINSSLILYPNPTRDILTISSELEIDRILITDLNGRTVLNQRIGNQNTIDVSGLQSGIYILNAQSDNKTLKPQRFIKK